uniref:WD_REPEATS_REGION domain-containing protein n=1 Tax=Panagrellus redivivus TaxID=6233 RepID=A0A7E4VVD4_PANRE
MPEENTPTHDLSVEQSFLLQEDGFTVKGFAVNNKIGKVAVLRRHDRKSAPQTIGLSKIEFYTTVDMPRIYLEKFVYIQSTLVEAIAWIGTSTLACVCIDGSVVALSPFSTLKKRYQVSPTPFWCGAQYSATEVVAGTDSGNVFFIKQKEPVDGEEAESGELYISRRFNVGSDERPMAIAASESLKTVAVGCLDRVFILDVSGATVKPTFIQLQREGHRATIAFSLLFFNQSLFIGDSRGHVSVYNAKNGALIKNMKTHQAPVLALASQGDCVFASGVDHRIQVMRQNAVGDRSDWQAIGQRMIHENDVSALAFVDKYLLSGGAEHDFLISIHQVKQPWVPIRTLNWTASTGVEYQLLPSLFNLTIVERIRTPTGEIQPAKLMCISSKTFPFEHSSMSPTGRHIVASTSKALKVYAMKDADGGPKRVAKIGQISSPGSVTAIAAAEDCVYFAVGDFELHRFNYASKTDTTLYVSEVKSSVRKLLFSADGKHLIVLTHRNTLFRFDLERLQAVDDEDEPMTDDENGAVMVTTLRELVVDIRSVDADRVVLLTTEPKKPLVILTLSNNTEKRIAIFTTDFRYPVAISDFVDNKLIVVSNRKDVAVIEFDFVRNKLSKYVGSVIAASGVVQQQGASEMSCLKRFAPTSRLAPQWATPPKENNKIHGLDSESPFGKNHVFVCGSQPIAPPTQVAFVIKRYQRN